jgi:peroxiredoxin
MQNLRSKLAFSTLFLSVLFILGNLSALASVSNFAAKDLLTQKTVQFPDAKAKATVVVFLSAKCPCSGSHEKSLAELFKIYGPQGFEFVGVHANQDETVAESEKHFKEIALPFPVVQDQNAKIANELKALKTPHAFIVQNGKVVFQGGVDDSAEAAHAHTFFLKQALEQVNANQSVTVASARALGCVIKR